MFPARQRQPRPTPPERREAFGHATWVKTEKREHPPQLLLAPVPLSLQSQHHSNRMIVPRALRQPLRSQAVSELPKIYLLGRWLNKLLGRAGFLCISRLRD